MQKLLYLLSVISLFSLDVYQTPPFHACLMISYIGTHIFRISFDSPDIKPFATMTIFKFHSSTPFGLFYKKVCKTFAFFVKFTN